MVNPMSDRRSSAPYRLIVEICGGVTAAFGLLALAGWLLAVPRFASLGQGLIPMAPSTALLFVAYGGGIFLVSRAPGSRRINLVVRAIFGGGALSSLALFCLAMRGVFLSIEHFGITTMGAVEGTPVGHMSPITAVTFVAISLSFLAVTSPRTVGVRRAITVWWIAVLLVAAYVMLMLAYLFGTPMFYGGSFIPPAANTSLAFFTLGSALAAFSRPLGWPDEADHKLGERYFSHALIVVFIFLVAGIISAGFFYHRKHEKQFLSEIDRQLSAIADLKMSELLLWREERLGDAGLFYRNAAFANLVKGVITHPEAGEALPGFSTWIGRLQANRNYDRIFLLDTQGENRWSYPENVSEPVSRYVRQKALESLRTGRITMADFYRHEASGKIYLSILVPIFDPAKAEVPLGVVVLRIVPEKYLYPFIQRWPVISKTAETLLVRRDGDSVLFLNDLKFRKNAALNLRIPLEKTDVPSVMAVLGREGVVRGIDYRGHSVLAVLHAIPDSPWFLITRMDLDEIYEPLLERQWITVLLVSVMLVCAGSGIGLAWRRQSSRFYRDKYEEELKRVALEERLAKIADNVPGAIFQCRILYDTVCLPYASGGLMPLYGIHPDEVTADISPLLAMIHPDDVAVVTATIGESSRSLLPWHNEHRVIHPARGTIWVEGYATPECKSDGSVQLYGFLTDVTERKEKEQELEQKNCELERFTYTVSHDLKSPLVTIKTFLGYLEEDLKRTDASRIEQDLGFMHTAADKMSRLLGELLELSRVGRLNNAVQESAFTDLVHEALELDAGRISSRGVVIAVGDSSLVLRGDRPRLVEIWQNLVENACKFMGNQEQPRIEIGVEECGQETRFFVRDNGIGIDPRFHTKIFGLFEKLEAGGEGTGLGLALVKRIVELYDGTIRIESPGEGMGSTFIFTLPAALKK